MIKPITPVVFERFLADQNIQVSYERKGAVDCLSFGYASWETVRKTSFRLLALELGLRRRDDKRKKVELWRQVCAAASKKSEYERRVRKVCFARMIDALMAALPELGKREREIIAGAALSGCNRRLSTVTGSATFKATWNVETLRECLKFRRHQLPTAEIETKADIDRYVLRHLDTMDLSCRRMTKRWILERRYFANYYDRPEVIRAVDCSFKYTGSAYAFRKVMKNEGVVLSIAVPEVFFRKAGQMIRHRRLAGWLRDEGGHLRDLSDSVKTPGEFEDIIDRAVTERIHSWSALEQHSKNWHEQQVRESFGITDDAPFLLPPGVQPFYQRSGYRFSALSNPNELINEGREMHHCIFGYAGAIRSAGYLAFRVEGNGERATAGFVRSAHGWRLDQVRGSWNREVSSALKSACRNLSKDMRRHQTHPEVLAS